MIAGFSFPFAKILLERLKEMYQSNKVLDSERTQKSSEGELFDLIDEAFPVVSYLIEQINFDERESFYEYNQMTRSKLSDLIRVAESFLSNFEPQD